MYIKQLVIILTFSAFATASENESEMEKSWLPTARQYVNKVADRRNPVSVFQGLMENPEKLTDIEKQELQKLVDRCFEEKILKQVNESQVESDQLFTSDGKFGKGCDCLALWKMNKMLKERETGLPVGTHSEVKIG